MIEITEHYLTRKPIEEPFHDPQMLENHWGAAWGVHNEIGRIKSVLMHRPGEEVLKLPEHAEQIEAGSVISQHITSGQKHQRQEAFKLDLPTLQTQHHQLVQTLQKEGIEVHFIEEEGQEEGWPERLFTRDLGMVVPGGILMGRLALHIRYGESRMAAQKLSSIGMPLLGTVHGYGFAEGGSFMMLDASTAIIGRSERVNLEGIAQVKQLLAVQNIELLVIDLPSNIIHLDEAFMPVHYDIALVNTALLPYWFLAELRRRKYHLLDVDSRDPQLTINGLTIAPGKFVITEEAIHTIALLEEHKITVIPVPVSEILKLGGGIHCVTLPLIREAL